MLTRLARWWLERRGVVLLDSTFNGVAFGNCTAVEVSSCQYLVTANDPCRIIALNHSVVMKDHIGRFEPQRGKQSNHETASY